MTVTGGDLKEPVTFTWQLRDGNWIIITLTNRDLFHDIMHSSKGWGNTPAGFRRMCRHLNLTYKWIPVKQTVERPPADR